MGGATPYLIAAILVQTVPEPWTLPLAARNLQGYLQLECRSTKGVPSVRLRTLSGRPAPGQRNGSDDQRSCVVFAASAVGDSRSSRLVKRATKSPSMNPTIALRISRTSAEISPLNQRNLAGMGTEFCTMSRTSSKLRPMTIPIFTRPSLFSPMPLTRRPNKNCPMARELGRGFVRWECGRQG
jgi:hypothetical protein